MVFRKLTQVYIYLAANGPDKASAIVDYLNINRGQVYKSLKRLQNKGVTTSSDEHPIEFSAVPFEDVLDMPMKIKKEKVEILQARKNSSRTSEMKRKNKLYWLTILTVLFFFTLAPAIDMLFYSLFVPFEVLWVTYSFVFLMLPLMITLDIAGGSIGYKIYRRVEKLT